MEVNGEEEAMKKCSKECIPCCDYCKYVVHEVIEVDGRQVPLEPFGCCLHLDARHQRMAKSCSFCEDFTCRNMEV